MNDVLEDTGLIIFQLNKPPNLICHKKKILDISQTFLNKPSKAITDRLTEAKARKQDRNSLLRSAVIEYNKTDYFTYESEKDFLLLRYVDFTFSENANGIVVAYYMLMGFEGTSAKNAVLQNIQPKVIE